MTNPALQTRRTPAALLALLAVGGCGAWYYEDVGVSHAPGAPRPRVVAVVPFRATIAGGEETRPPSSYFGPHATDGCKSALVQAGVEVVAPGRIEGALFRADGVALDDPEKVAGVARQLGADAVVLGAVDVRKFNLVVDARLVRAENGAVDAHAHVEGRKDEDVLARDACKALVSSEAGGR
jgi:hypothetical protein